MRGYRDLGYRVFKMKIGGAPLDEDLRRIEAALEIVGEGAGPRGRCQWPLRPGDGDRLRQGDRPITCSGTRRPGDPLDYALQAELAAQYPGRWRPARTCSRMQDARNLVRHGGMRPERDVLQFDCALSYGLVEYLRTLEMLRGARLEPAAGRAARRPPDVA